MTATPELTTLVNEIDSMILLKYGYFIAIVDNDNR